MRACCATAAPTGRGPASSRRIITRGSAMILGRSAHLKAILNRCGRVAITCGCSKSFMKLSEKLLSRWRHMFRPGERVAVAVSGGADSVALLRLLLALRAELGIVLSALHFNHKIRGAEADADEAFVKALAAEHSLELRAACEDVPAYAQAQRMSLEEAAREKRYQFFNSYIVHGMLDCVATAHTLDDQAETVLMRLMRGAGTRGLAGILAEIKVEEEDRQWIGADSGRIGSPRLAGRGPASEK